MTRGTNACCVMYELHPMFAPCPSCHLLGPPLLPLTRGNPVTGITPPSFARSRHTFFCTDVSMSCRNRNVVVALFCYRCRGTPFVFATMTNASYLIMSTFIKDCIKLANVIRIMIITFKMFKIVVCLKLLNAYGVLPELLFGVPASFKLA